MISGIPTDKFKIDKTLKYKYVYLPSHALANKAGKVYEHNYVICKTLNRFLNSNEVIHHKDRNRSNNTLSNLMVLTRKEHMELHAKEDGKETITTYHCKYCNNIFNAYPHDNKSFCSDTCYRLASRKFEITADSLHELVWKYPTVKVAKMLGVSDVAISKRCKVLSIPKPPRGYWAKVAANKI